MWLFLTARLRQWLILAVLVPVVTTLVHVIRTRIEARSGSTRLTRLLARLEGLGQRRGRGRRGRRSRR
jgi:hypothetical protein